MLVCIETGLCCSCWTRGAGRSGGSTATNEIARRSSDAALKRWSDRMVAPGEAASEVKLTFTYTSPLLVVQADSSSRAGNLIDRAHFGSPTRRHALSWRLSTTPANVSLVSYNPIIMEPFGSPVPFAEPAWCVPTPPPHPHRGEVSPD